MATLTTIPEEPGTSAGKQREVDIGEINGDIENGADLNGAAVEVGLFDQKRLPASQSFED